MGAFAKQVAKAMRGKKTPAGAAKAVYKVCREFAEKAGMKPDIEVGIFKPGQDRWSGQNGLWAVTFEAGPYEWAIEASMEDNNPHVLAEPYMSFDLHFYPN